MWKDWKYEGFLELASAHVLHLPSIMSRVLWMEVMNWVFWKVLGMEEAYWKGSKYEYEGLSDRGTEYKEYRRDSSAESTEGRVE